MIELGRFQIDLEMRTLWQDGEVVRLGSRAFDILAVVTSAAGRLVTKDELMNAVWPETIVEENNIHVHLSALRKILGPDRGLILTVPGRGYQLLQAPKKSPPEEADLHTSRGRRLPSPKADFVGRDRAVSEIRAMLDQTHVLTLVGAGGIGKTSLAIEAARHAAPDFPEPVCLVELATLNTHEAVLAAIVEGCGLPMFGQQTDIEQVATALGKNRRLLLLDNAEHVIRYVAETVESLIAANTLLRVLVTSREPLRIVPETVFRVDPLDVPPPHSSDTEILQRSAVNLFLMRANSLQGQGEAESLDIQLVGEICRRLDGIPLAIELAAARIVSLGVEGVYRRLDDRMAILSGGYRTALPRHQTLRATFDWSYALLERAAQALFRRLAMFGGIFTLEAMCAVACDAELTIGVVIDGIGELVTKSLVNVKFDGPVAKYRLTESTRAYALERLQAEGEAKKIAARQARYLSVHFKAEANGVSSGGGDTSSTLRHTLDDARSVFDWAFSPRGDARLGVELTSTLAGALLDCCMIEECCRRTSHAVAVLDSLPPGSIDTLSEMRIRAALASTLLNVRGPIKCSAELWHDVMTLAKESRNDEFQARAFWGLWNALMSGGYVYESISCATQFLKFAEERSCKWQVSLALQLEAVARHCLGEHAQARTQLEAALLDLVAHEDEAQQIARFAVDSRAICYATLARIVWLQGEPEKAMELVDKTVNLIRPETMEPWLTHVLGVVAVPLALMSGDRRRGIRYLEIMRSQTALHQFDIWHDYCECLAGYGDVLEGRLEHGLPVLETALDALIARGFRRLITPFIVTCAEALIAVGRLHDAGQRLREARSFCRKHGKLFFLPEVLRALGVAAQAEAEQQPHSSDARRDKLAEAQASFLEAIQLSRMQGAYVWELRATTGMARLLHAQRLTRDAVDILSDMAVRFEPKCTGRDVQEMLTLIEALRACVDSEIITSPTEQPHMITCGLARA